MHSNNVEMYRKYLYIYIYIYIYIYSRCYRPGVARNIILEIVYELQKLTSVEPIIPGTRCYLLI